ncbi:metallophosphoesterase [Streptomyces sioyaensis]|uniref:metallophosphoesterase n=1 Tax=Streptomyces sioyaensis TaxID=67364 RepID=UPI0037CF26A7
MQELIATGCVHSALPEGRAALATIRAAKQAGALIVDAGDFFSGSAFHAFSHGQVEERVLTELYDAVVPGNHDLPDLMRLKDPTRFPPVVCANLRPPAGYRGRWHGGVVLAGHAHRIGIVGYLGRQAFEAIPRRERSGFVFTDPTAELIGQEAARLRAEGADVVIGVSHSGFLRDVADQEAGWPLDTVVAAHCHSPWSHWSTGHRHVAKPPAAGAGLLRLHLAPSGLRQVVQESPHGPVEVDRELQADLAAYEAWGAEVVGALDAPIPGGWSVARHLADRARVITGARHFLVNTYTFRGGLPALVRRRDLVACAPFDSALVVLNDDIACLDALVRRASELGEALTISTVPQASDGDAVAMTSYLAERLGLSAWPADPPRTLRGVLTDLVQEAL